MTNTTTGKATKTLSKRAERAAQRARLDAISAGLAAEVAAVNAAIASGVAITLPMRDGSMTSGKTVARVSYGYDGIWVEMRAYGGRYAYANDGRWDEIVKLAGLARDPRAV